MVSYSTPYQVTRSWILSIVLRSAALLLNLASIGLISALFIHGIQDVLFMILYALVAIWSIIDLILLFCRRAPHPAVNIGLDAASFAVLAGVGGWQASFGHRKEQLETQPQMAVGDDSGLLSSIFHLIMAIRACVEFWKHYQRKRSSWEASQMHLF